MRHVIDASVAAKWFIPEDHSELALRLLEGNEELYAPDLLYAEFGNILWKKQRRGELLREHAAKAIAGLHAVPLRVHPSKSLLDLALDIASTLDRSVYDSLYLSLAFAKDCALVTADRRLYNGLQGTALQARVMWVEAISREGTH